MTKELVISAYERDYSWINLVNDNIKKTVYRKGTKLTNQVVLGIIYGILYYVICT